MTLSIATIPGAQRELDRLASGPKSRHFRMTMKLGAEFDDRGLRLLPGASDPPYYLCNLVLQGGGALGLAHVGFVAGLEQAGVRFVGLAGTSAGAIVACATACARENTIQKPVAEALLELVSAMPMASFIDGPPVVRTLLKRFFGRQNLYSGATVLGGLTAFRHLLKYRGLNPGEEFLRWLELAYAQMGIKTVEDLDGRLAAIVSQLRKASLPRDWSDDNRPNAAPAREWREAFPEDLDPPRRRHDPKIKPFHLLQVMAMAQPAGIKFCFPEDLKYLAPSYRKDSPACFVRASMSVPAFFHPHYMNVDEKAWAGRVERHLGKFEAPGVVLELKRLRSVAFLDGGLLSNLPLDAFSRVPAVPTLAVSLAEATDPLKAEYRYSSSIRGAARDAGLLLNGMRRQRDLDARDRANRPTNPQGDISLVSIDTKDANWLNFSMDRGEMADLFMCGLEAARKFILTDYFRESDDERTELAAG